MAFNTVPSVAPLDSWTSSQHNTYIKDNLTALWPYTTAGDTAYATAANTLGRVAIGAAGAINYSTGSAPAWKAIGAAGQFLGVSGTSPTWSPLVYSRQGGAADNWQTAGGSTYNPTTTQIEAGSRSVTSGTPLAITYPNAFTYRPLIFLTVNTSTNQYTLSFSDDTLSGFTINLQKIGGGADALSVNWLAIGQ